MQPSISPKKYSPLSKNNAMQLHDIQKIYFIGIGGIGMSALARYFKQHRGAEVYGYDRTPSPLTDALTAEGMHIHFEDDTRQIPEGIDLVVYTPAIPSDHGELNYFRERGYVVLKRAAVLGIISRGMKAIAIGGTHGKTTTTSITTHILRSSGIDCSAFLGGIAENFQSNYVAGSGEWFVVEADEYDRSFLQLNPEITAILSMDADHLDIYGDVAAMHDTFREFVQRTNDNGRVLYRSGLPLDTPTDSTFHLATFGEETVSDFQIHHLRFEAGYSTFDVTSPMFNMTDVQFTLPGRHNALNALVGIAIAQWLGASAEGIRAALQTFKGIKRRFEFVVRGAGTVGSPVFIDDYAHHPTELTAAIQATRELYPEARITGIFQPHLYSRTQDFYEGFAAALDLLDEAYLLPIYPAREQAIPGVTSEGIAERMQLEAVHLVPKEELLDRIDWRQQEVVLTLGAGDIDRLVPPIAKRMGGLA